MIYDTLIDFIKISFSSFEFLKPYATTAGIIWLILKQHGIRKMINGSLPKRFRDTHESDSQQMKQDIEEIKYDVKLLKTHQGVVGEWSSTQQNGQRTIPILLYKRFFLFLRMDKILRRKKLMEKLKSRKLWLAIFGALFPVLNVELGINLDPNVVFAVLGVVISGIAGLAHVDGKRAQAVVKALKESVPIDPNATYKDMFPTIKEAHDKINKFLEMAKTNDVNVLAMYPKLNELLDSYIHPSPVAVIVEDKVAS